MRSFLSICCLLISAFALVYGQSSQSGTCGNNLTWSLDFGVLTIKGFGDMKNFEKNGAPWNNQRLLIKEIFIQNNVTTIGNYAFFECSNLVNVTIPEKVTSIGNYSFGCCSSLETVVLPLYLGAINESAFYSCTMLERINIPEKVRYIGSRAFKACSNIPDVTIPLNVSFIGAGVFEECNSLESITVNGENKRYYDEDGVLFTKSKDEEKALIQFPGKRGGNYTIPDDVVIIDAEAFLGCNQITSVIVPTNVSIIHSRAFGWCESLVSVIVNESNPHFLSIDGVLFRREKNYSLTLVVYPGGKNNTSYVTPANVSEIGYASFWGNNHIENVTISEGVKVIGTIAFAQCDNLKKLILPASITLVKAGAFAGCNEFESIDVDEGNQKYKSVDGVLLDENNTLVQYPAGRKQNIYTIPANVTTIGKLSFYLCENLAVVIIPENVTTIESRAFEGCKNLKNVSIPASVTVVDGEVFSFSGLESFFYEGITDISNCRLSGLVNLNVCVPQEYSDITICGVDVTSEARSCESFLGMANKCFAREYINGRVVDGLTDSAREWMDGSDDCMERRCDNESGFVAWSKCSSGSGITRMCVNNQCIEEKPVDNGGTTVEIDFVEPIRVKDAIDTDTLGFLIDCGINPENLTIGWEMDEEGNIIRILVYVDDEKTANDIVQSIQQKCLEDSN